MKNKLELIQELKNQISEIRTQKMHGEIDAVKAVSLELSILNSIVRLQDSIINEERLVA